MKIQIIGILLLLLLGPLFIEGNAQQPHQKRMDDWKALDWSLKYATPSVRPKNGFVPDESTAVKIAEAVAIAHYGEKTISEERPFRARLRGDTWTVMGTLHPEGVFGGTAVVKLSKTDGRVLFMIHQY